MLVNVYLTAVFWITIEKKVLVMKCIHTHIYITHEKIKPCRVDFNFVTYAIVGIGLDKSKLPFHNSMIAGKQLKQFLVSKTTIK